MGIALLAVYFVSQRDSPTTSGGIVPGMVPAATTATDRVVFPLRLMPTDQQWLVNAVSRGRADFAAGSNDMAKGAARPQRAKAICSVLRPLAVKEWFGTIETLSSNGAGKGVLAVRLSKDLTLKTWSNAVSDVGDHTLIEPASALFAAVSHMKVGDPVIFAGAFFRSETDCLEEASMTLQGSMERPEFIFKFSDVRAG